MSFRAIRRFALVNGATRCTAVAALTVGVTVATPGWAAAQTQVTANITANTTWTAAGSPYILTRPLTSVSSGVTLTVQPGVTVQFNGGQAAALSVSGRLSALGTAEHPIVFTSQQAAAGQGALGQYQGVILSAASTGADLSYVTFRYGGYGTANSTAAALRTSASVTDRPQHLRAQPMGRHDGE